MLVYGPITTTNAGAPASWLMTYPSSIIAATYYLRFDSTLPGGALIDADDVLILVPVTGIVGASTIAPWTTPAALPCAT